MLLLSRVFFLMNNAFYFSLFIISTSCDLLLHWHTRSKLYKMCLNMTQGVRFASKVGQIGPKWDNSGTFQDIFQSLFAHWAKLYWNLIWKCPNFVPFWANMTLFEVKPDTSEITWDFITRVADSWWCCTCICRELLSG